MRKSTGWFLIFEMLDGITTLGGLTLAPLLVEANPLLGLGWPGLILFKVGVTAGVALVLQRKRPWWGDGVVPLVAALPVGWNMLNILTAF
jgi:hypothetical protein